MRFVVLYCHARGDVLLIQPEMILTDRYPNARLIPSISARRSAAAIAPYRAAMLYSTLARSYDNELSDIGASGVSEKGGGKGR